MTATIQGHSENAALSQRAGWYRLLAGAFVEEPRGEYLQALREGVCLEALASLGVAFDSDFLAGSLADLEEALACEYTMLFAASGGFPPVESVRLQGGYRQAASSEVKAAYAAEGFAVSAGRFETFDDNLGVELQFLAALLERQAAAAAAGDATESRRLDKAVKRFWVQHPGRWVRAYSELIEGAAEHSFYREMARLLRAFAEDELALLGLDVADEDGGRWRAPRPAECDQPMVCGGTAP